MIIQEYHISIPVSGNGNGVAGSNLTGYSPGVPSPEEQIIQQRGRRSTAIRNIMMDLSAMETDEEATDLPDLPQPVASTSLNDSGFGKF